MSGLNTSKQSTNRLGEMLRVYLAVKQIPLRTAADEIGIAAPTLMRISHGRSFDAETMLKLWTWMMEE